MKILQQLYRERNQESPIDADQRLLLRRLKFPPALEQTFITDYYAKILPWLRNGLTLLLLLLALFWIRDYGSTGEARLGVYITPGLLLLALLLCSFHRRTVACWQPLVCLFGGMLCLVSLHNLASTMQATSMVTDEWHREDTFMLYECIAMICALVMTRLWFVWITIFGWMVVLIGILIAISTLHISAELVFLRNASILIPAMGVLMFGGYMQERSARGEFLANHLLAQERARTEELLLNILPGSVVERLKTEPGAIADGFAEVSVLFADIVNFTPFAARLSAEETVHLLNDVFSAFDRLVDRHRLEKIKTIGDAYMVVGGLPEPHADHLEAIAALALEMQQAMTGFERQSGEPLQLRIGIHVGPVVAGVIGTRKFSYDLWGDTVNVASRMESHGVAGAIQVTEAIRSRLQAKYRFDTGRTLSIKGCGQVQVYRLLGHRKEATQARL